MSPDVEARFWSKVDRGPGCWEWTASKSTGYGRFTIRKGTIPVAHRVAWELLRGPIPSGMQLDHLCRNRACVNPDHLEPVSCQVNLLRGETRAASNVVKVRCPQEHPYDDENTYLDKRGARSCRECKRARHREYMATRRAAA